MIQRPGSNLARDPYRGVSLILLAAAILGMTAAFAGGLELANPVMLAAGISMGLAAGILAGVLKAQAARTERPAEAGVSAPISKEELEPSERASEPPPSEGRTLLSRFKRDIVRVSKWLEDPDLDVTTVTAIAGISAIGVLLLQNMPTRRPTPLSASIAIVLSLVAAGLAAVAARYLGEIDSAEFPESLGLCCGARLAVWIFVLMAASPALAWTNQQTLLRILYFVLLAANAWLCYSLFRARPSKNADGSTFPLDFGLLSAFGSRQNILASVLDAAEKQFGIDLRSTWALTILRRALEPLALCLCLAAWLSTCLSVVGMDEQAIVERLGVPPAGLPLEPGVHLHWPWPVDRVFRIPVQRVQTVQVGHEGEEQEGPENVLWAVEHAPNEYTLLLGNGRDLITVDAAVQYRIVDAYAWRYHCQNPAAALRAIAYRAVMRSTVNLTLSEALSQNITILTEKMRAMVQKEADDLGLGVDILAFTVSGMHPPVPVATAYEAVVSAELGKVTATVNAQAFRNRTVPSAESDVLAGENAARADGAQAVALAAGQAWSFRALESQYHAAPEEYFFRRRLEALEKTLPEYSYTVIDSRFLRDGGEIWSTR